jgi:lipopolysaccharide transport system ATP-binding protein
MGEVSSGGRTVLFVTHNMVAVQTLCRKAVLLRDGKLAGEGSAASIVSAYLTDANRGELATQWETPEQAPGNDALRVRQVRVLPTRTRDDGLIGMDSPIQVDTDFWVLKPGVRLHITYHLLNEQGVTVLTTGCPSQKRDTGLFRASFTLPAHLLNSGDYSLRFLIVQDNGRLVYDHHGLAMFSVVDLAEREHGWTGREPGVVQPILPWAETPIDSLAPALTHSRLSSGSGHAST